MFSATSTLNIPPYVLFTLSSLFKVCIQTHTHTSWADITGVNEAWVCLSYNSDIRFPSSNLSVNHRQTCAVAASEDSHMMTHLGVITQNAGLARLDLGLGINDWRCTGVSLNNNLLPHLKNHSDLLPWASPSFFLGHCWSCNQPRRRLTWHLFLLSVSIWCLHCVHYSGTRDYVSHQWALGSFRRKHHAAPSTVGVLRSLLRHT